MQATLISRERGYDDFDISGVPGVHRASVPHGIKRGHRFNVYCDNCRKLGAVWAGSLDRSLASPDFAALMDAT